MIHVLDYNGQIIDFISRDDNSVIRAVYNRDANNDTLDITVLSARAEHFKKRNRVLIQDKNEVYREYIIERAEEDEGYLEVECTASYLLDIATSKPIPSGKYEKMTINQKLSETLRDSGWIVGDCDYAGVKTNSWTSVRTPLEMISQLETAHEVKADYEVVIDGYEVVERRVNMRKPNPLFKGKEIVYGKDLSNMKRIVDYSEVKTALFAFGPETEEGTRIETIVVDDEAQEQFNLPYRYIWGIYEPETEDEDMTLKRLTTLARTELNKRKSAALSYEISVVDLENEFPHEMIRFGDIVRIKNPDFTPALYAESEVVGIEHDLISDDCTYEFGKVVEFEEDDLFKFFRSKLDYINQKLNDGFTNVNTIIKDTLDNELQYFEQKIIKGTTPPDNPVNDLLWFDTSNPNVAVLRRYWNGKWIESTVEDVEQIGGVTREKSLFSELSNTFINLSIQHSRLLNDVYEVINSEYFVDSDLINEVQNKLNDTIDVFNAIKASLDGMRPETATIGKLVDTQALFLEYRQRMQSLYTSVENAKIAIDARFKLLQSQYTDEKFNEAMEKVADSIGGYWDSESNQLIADIPNQAEMEQALQLYVQGHTSMLHQMLLGEMDSKLKVAQDELSNNISAVSAKVDGIEIGGRNLLNHTTQKYLLTTPLLVYSSGIEVIDDKRAVVFNKSNNIIYLNGSEYSLQEGQTYTFSFYAKVSEPLGFVRGIYINGQNAGFIPNTIFTTEWKRYSFSFVAKGNNPLDIHMYPKINNGDGTYKSFYITDWQLEKGNKMSDVTPAPEDYENQLEPIKATQVQQSTDLKQLKDSITLKADKSDVTTLYDNNIKPLETQVNDNTAQLQIQSDKIDSKVSNTQYTADVDDIVTRLNTADTQRTQLSNAINDRVTIKEYTDNKIETTNQINTAIDNVKVGGRNYLLETDVCVDKSNKAFSISNLVMLKNETYTLSIDIDMINGSPGSQKRIGGEMRLNYKDGTFEYFSVWLPVNTTGVNYKGKYTTTKTLSKDVASFSNFTVYSNLITADKAVVCKPKLEKGNKATDWTPAPEDVKADIDKAKAETDKTLNVMQTQINQNGTDINARASKEEFNASRKTLSKVVSDLTINTTTGLTLSYDENGVIQSSTVGPDGIKLDATKIDINNGDVLIQNGRTYIKDAYIDKLFSKQATINYLNSVDITAKRLQAVDNKAVVGIEGGSITMNRSDGTKLDLSIDGIAMYNSSGSKRFSIDPTLVTSAALGTSNANVYLGTGSDYEARVVDIVGLPSDGYLNSYKYRPLRAEGFYGNYWNVNTAKTLGEPMHLYARPLSGGELRVTLNERTSNYQNLRADGIYGNYVNVNGLHGDSRHLYLRPLSNGEVRVTLSETTDNFVPLRVQHLFLEGGQIGDNSNGNSYLGSNGEWRFTSNQFYNGGNPSYRDIRFRNWTAMSSEKYKYDISEWNYSVLDAFRNDLKLYKYKNLSEQDDVFVKYHHGIIIEREIPIEWRNGDGFDGNEVMFWNTKAIQELIHKVDELEKKVEESTNEKTSRLKQSDL